MITTALTIYMENLAMKTLSAAETTLIFSTEPLWGTAFAAVFMNEQLGPTEAVGAVFILIACISSNLGTDGMNELASKSCGKSSSISKDDDDSPLSSSDDSSIEDSEHEDIASISGPASNSSSDVAGKKKRVRFTDDLISRAKDPATSWLARRRSSPHKNQLVLPR